jgi:ribosomal protein L13E
MREDRRERLAEEREPLVSAAQELHKRLGRGFSQSEWRRHGISRNLDDAGADLVLVRQFGR